MIGLPSFAAGPWLRRPVWGFAERFRLRGSGNQLFGFAARCAAKLRFADRLFNLWEAPPPGWAAEPPRNYWGRSGKLAFPHTERRSRRRGASGGDAEEERRSRKKRLHNMKVLIVGFLILAMTSIVYSQKGPVTIFLAGDSTMAQKVPEKRPETGWGEMLAPHFKDGKVGIDNRAANGRSTKTFISEGKWQSIIDDLRKGDYVFIQFGHNDSSKDKGERYTPPEDYRRNLAKFVGEVSNKGGHPVLLTPVMRRRFDKDGKFYDTHGEYPDLVRTAARELNVPIIDMHRMSETVILRYGVEDSRKLFLQLKPGENANYPNGIDDNTHFSPLGAEEMAKLAIDGIRTSGMKLRKHLKQ